MARFITLLFLVWVTLLLLPNPIHTNAPHLHQLNVIFRHGDRNPETDPKRFPNDPNMYQSFQPAGSGGLTNEGKRRMFHLGELLRAGYDDFLGPELDQRRLYAVSSNLGRTKMSLQLVLAALYPPFLSQRTKWHPRLDWQPIPTEYSDFKHDRIFNRDKCDNFVEEYSRVSNSSEVQAELTKYQPFLDELRLLSGKAGPFTLDDVLILHSNLEIENRLNMRMEPWMSYALKDFRLKKLRQLYYQVNGYNDKLRRLQGGYLLRRINDQMRKASDNATSYSNKISLYSGHDKNLVSLLQSLDVYDSHFPEFGSAIILELLSKEGQYYVKILYYLGIPAKTKTITLPGCEPMCPLDRYLNLTRSAEIMDDEFNCVISSDSYFG